MTERPQQAPDTSRKCRDIPVYQQAGVTVLNRDKCDDSYRLYSGRATETARLIDLDGRIVHQWSCPQGHTWHYAHMLDDGHLVAIVKDVMILELDWDSNLVWTHATRAHHDFARLDNGNTLVASRRAMANPWTNAGELHCDILMEVTPAGQTVWQWQVETRAAELGRRVNLIMPPSPEFGDWPHVNTVEVLPHSPAADKDGRFRQGNLLICGRHIDTIWVIDRQSDEIVWAWGPGELLGPHMPTMLPNGHLLVYDNGWNVSTGYRDYTRVIEMDPLTERIVWQYVADPPESFYSPARGSNEWLPNGNTLIAESDPGRTFEVTPGGEIVWEFICPDRHADGRPQALYRTLHYPRGVVDALLARHGGA